MSATIEQEIERLHSQAAAMEQGEVEFMEEAARSRELRVLCRLAWNNWPDNEASRKIIAEQEARDPISAAAWDRVIAALSAAYKGK